MTEAETRAEHIDPAVEAAAWDVLEGESTNSMPRSSRRCSGSGTKGEGRSHCSPSLGRETNRHGTSFHRPFSIFTSTWQRASTPLWSLSVIV